MKFHFFPGEESRGPALSTLPKVQVDAVMNHLSYKRFLAMRAEDRDFLVKTHPYKIFLLMDTADDVIKLSLHISDEAFYDFVKANTFKTADKQSVIDLFGTDLKAFHKLEKANPNASSILSHARDPEFQTRRWVPMCK